MFDPERLVEEISRLALDYIQREWPEVTAEQSATPGVLMINGRPSDLRGIAIPREYTPDSLRASVEEIMPGMISESLFFATIADAEAVKAHVLPFLFDAEHVTGPSADNLRRIPVAGLVVVPQLVVCVSKGPSGQHVWRREPSVADLKGWSITPEELHQAALVNLAKQASQFTCTPCITPSIPLWRCWLLTASHRFMAATILLEEMRVNLARMLGSDSFLVGLPKESSVVAFPSSPEQLVASLTRTVRTEWELTPRIFRAAKEGLTPYDPA